MSVAFKIAKRFLSSSKLQTILIICGIAIGVSVQIFIGLLIQGLQKSLINKTVGNSAQITINAKSDLELINNWQNLMREVNKADKRIKFLSVAVDAPAFVENGKKSEAVLLRGFNLDKDNKIYKVKNSIIKGKLPQKNSEIIIGKELAKKLKLVINDKFPIIDSRGKKSRVKISGIYDLKVKTLNEKWLISNIDTAQQFILSKNKITALEMQVKDVFKADKISIKINKKLAKKYNIKAKNWLDENEQLLSGLKGQDMSSLIIQVFVMIAVLLGISSVLAVTVVQKSRQIGILKAMGIKDNIASLIFLFQGMLLGLIGSIVGVLFGLGLLKIFETFALNPDGTPVVPIYINYEFILLSGVVAIIVSTFAALIPAQKSSRLSPIEVIRIG